MKNFLFLVLVVVLLSPSLVLAANNGAGQGNSTGSGNGQSGVMTPVPSMSASIQTQTKTQNAGEEKQNPIQTKEQTNTSNGGTSTPSPVMSTTQTKAQTKTQIQTNYSPKSEMATQRMSVVAQTVQSMLMVADRNTGTNSGIGEQIRLVAQTQVQSQDLVNQKLDQAENRSTFAKFFIGANYSALKSVKQEVQQNQLRIQLLNELALTLTNAADQTELQNQIQVLEEQNTSLENQLKLDIQGFSLFGWLSKIVNKY